MKKTLLLSKSIYEPLVYKPPPTPFAELLMKYVEDIFDKHFPVLHSKFIAAPSLSTLLLIK